MLAKRTNILFDETLLGRLQAVARQRRVSLGRLVRDAVQQVYFSSGDSLRKQHALSVIRDIRRLSRKRIDYHALIHAGRKY